MADKQLGYWSNRDEQAICVDFPGMVGFYRLFAQVGTDDEFQVFAQLQIRVPHGCQAAVAETVERANYLQRDGNFEINLEAKELRFHIAESISDGELRRETVDRLLETARIGLETCLVTILSVIYGNEQPEDAVRQMSANAT